MSMQLRAEQLSSVDQRLRTHSKNFLLDTPVQILSERPGNQFVAA